MLFEKNLTTGEVTDSFWANGLQVAQLDNGTASYLLLDALGSVRYQTSGSDSVLFSSNYQPYGDAYGQLGVLDTMFTGKLMDVVDGLYYFGARFYDPATGRFITEDTNIGSKEDPMKLNRFIYARDNPSAIVDPSGHSWNPFSAVASAVTNVASSVTNAVSSAASTVTNTWDSLPPSEQTGILVGVSVALAVGTLGIAAPAVAALDAGVISEAVGSIAVAAVGTGASMAGFPALSLATEISLDLTPDESAALAAAADGYQRTGIVTKVLASFLPDAETPSVYDSFCYKTSAGRRFYDLRYDANSPSPVNTEVKNSGDPVTRIQVQRDTELLDGGLNVEYALVKTNWGGPSADDISLLEQGSIPYVVYNFISHVTKLL